MKVTVTNAGFAALPSTAGGVSELRLAEVALGHGQAANDPATTALEHEDTRLPTIAGQAVSARVIHLVIRDQSTAAYTVREFGLYTAAGELFAVYSQAEPIIEKSAGSTLLLALDIDFDNIDVSELTFASIDFINPPWSTTVKGVLKRATTALAEGLRDNTTGMTPRRTADAIAAWLGARKPGADGGLDADLLDGEHGSFYRDAGHLNKGTLPRARLPHASGAAYGAVRFASTEQAKDGRNNSRGMTPKLVADLVTRMLNEQRNKDWPVGSIYCNAADSTNPGQFLPGTWTKISEGFLYPHGAASAGSVGSTGGEKEVKLTAGQMPKHTHGASTKNAGGHSHTRGSMNITGAFRTRLFENGNRAVYSAGGAFRDEGNSGDSAFNTLAAAGGQVKRSHTTFDAQRSWSGRTSNNGSHNHSVTVNSAGGSQAHNNMPPYVTVYMWRRTA